MLSTSNVAEQIGQAWNHHREGRYDAAIAAFDAILKQSPNDIDANYGLGLSQKTAGRADAARQTFQNTLRLVERARDEYTSTRTGDSNVKTPEDDRFMMLSRMVTQRLAEIDRAK